ncbi:MAG: DUF4351 domain-containing protein [Candidatus Competibacteraceae bacterium]
MRYLSTIERMFIDRGFQKGLDEGNAGGKTLGKAKLLTRLLQRRFGPLPDRVETRLGQAMPAQLDAWADRVFDAILLEAAFE